MTNLAKAGIVVAGLGTVGGGGILANSLLNKPDAVVKKTVQEELFSEGFEAVPTGEWQTILNAYKLVKDTKVTFKKTTEESEDLNGLKAKCTSVLSKKEASQEDYKKARQWCVKTVTVETVLGNLGYELLNTDTSNTTNHDAIWGQKVASLKLTPDSFPTIGAKMKGTDSAADIRELKAGCTGLGLKTAKTTDKDFNDKLERGRSWCAKPKKS